MLSQSRDSEMQWMFAHQLDVFRANRHFVSAFDYNTPTCIYCFARFLWDSWASLHQWGLV